MLAALAYVLLLALIALGVPLALSLRARVAAEVKTQAQAQADLVAATAADLLAPSDRPDLQTLAQTASRSVRGRVLIVSATGQVLVDSGGPGAVGTSYDSRPEIQAALRGHQLQVQRASKTLGQSILATAVPIVRNGRTVGAVRITEGMAAVGSAIRRAEFGLALIGLIVLALGLFAGAVIAAHVARPIKRMEQVARRVAQGDLGARVEVEGSREQRSLAASFNEMTTRIAALLGAQRQFVADASHQLRTPLTGLRLRLEEAKALTTSQAGDAELDAAIGELDRLTHTINELLAHSRAGEREVEGSAVDLGDAARAALERWRGPAGLRGGLITLHQESGRAHVWSARPDVDRALDVLIENAINYSAAHPAVQVNCAPGRIEVRDRGAGVGAGEGEAVFNRFHRGRAGLAGPAGSGLGLPIARELMRSWGGDVTLTPRPGGGTIATITLPAHDAPPGALPAVNPPASSVPSV
ncbi:MAG: hypothetical protein QOG59_2623 [Solirubrobacteraceae bacterium]|nr:hypothetical protein [Solirubrobacteraceae bacterium]